MAVGGGSWWWQEAIALSDDYFVERKLYPNVDFYSGIIYQVRGRLSAGAVARTSAAKPE